MAHGIGVGHGLLNCAMVRPENGRTLETAQPLFGFHARQERYQGPVSLTHEGELAIDWLIGQHARESPNVDDWESVHEDDPPRGLGVGATIGWKTSPHRAL
jgi:hypothetical protein